MLLSHRRRRGTYALAETEGLPRGVRAVIRIAIVLLVVYVVGSWLLRLLGVGTRLERAGAVLFVPDTGTITVAVDGGDQQRAQDGMKVYAGDGVSTGGGSAATMQFFDRTLARMGEKTQIAIDRSGKGSKQSAIELTVKSGLLWAATPDPSAFSGAIVRTLHSEGQAGTLSIDLTANAEVIVGPSGVAVYRSDGMGVTVKIAGRDPIVIGEGQKWTAPEPQALAADLYAHRSPLDVTDLRSPLLLESRRARDSLMGRAGAVATLPGEGILSVSQPTDGAVVEGTVVDVAGTVGEGVTRVTVNGRPALLDETARAFTQQVALEPARETTITVAALDADGVVLAEEKRLVEAKGEAAGSALPPPTIGSPAAGGQTYRTSKDEVVLRGSAPAGTVGIMVNDYELKLFNPEKATWSYLASARLGNLSAGKNVFNVYALHGDDRRKSPAAQITILREEGAEGVVTAGEAAGSSAASTGELPNNAPLTPGAIAVIAPVTGTSASLTGTGTLIEGTTSNTTDSIWVNDYRLQLYKPGRTAWNYIASPELQNLKPGTNTYVIVARNRAGEILDRLEYVIEYQP